MVVCLLDAFALGFWSKTPSRQLHVTEVFCSSFFTFTYIYIYIYIYIYTYSFLCGTSVVDCLIVISPFKCCYKTLRKHLCMFAFSLFLTDSWYIIFYLFIVFASFLCSMYLLLCGYITFKCLNKALGYLYVSSCIHFITLNTTQLHSLATSIL